MVVCTTAVMYSLFNMVVHFMNQLSMELPNSPFPSLLLDGHVTLITVQWNTESLCCRELFVVACGIIVLTTMGYGVPLL